MKVEIWSDIACPFCYIGKRHFEHAIATLHAQDAVEVEWKSFELDPFAQKDYVDDLFTLLANKYGQTRDWAIQSAASMQQRGKELGLEFKFDKVISTKTFDAHRLVHLAKSLGKQNEAEEALFEAYFKEGKHIGSHEVLAEIGKQIGLPQNDILTMLNSDLFANDVREDESLSRQFNIRGVPFFIVNRKYGISGAQPINHFLEVLKKTQNEETELMIANNPDGDSCSVDGRV